MSETLPLFSGEENEAQAPPVSGLARNVETVLKGQPGPWTVAQIRKQWPSQPVPKAAEIKAVLEELETRRRAHRLPGARGAVVWSARPLEAWLNDAERRILETVEAAGGPVAEKKLLAAVWPKGLDAARLRERLLQMEQDGRLKRWPGETPAWWHTSVEAWLDDAERRMVEVVEAAGGPVPEKKLLLGVWPKALESTPLRERLQEMERAGRLKRWPGKTPAWWHLSVEEALQGVLEETLGRRALPKAQWLREAKAKLRGPSAAQWQQAIADQIASGRVMVHTAKIGGKSIEVCVRAEWRAALLEVYRPVIDALREQWRRLGIRDEEVERFLSGRRAPDAEALLAELKRLEEENAPPNSVTRLRRRVAGFGWTKEEFDLAALELLRQGRVYMAPHDHPWRLPDEERNALVSDGRGNFYVSISSRA